MKHPACISCERTQEEVPLLSLHFHNTIYYVCPQHLPVLIHHPQMLAGKLPGAEGMTAAEHKD